MTREKLIDKINKIMALAENNPSEEEAASAASKAQALLAEYNLTLGDLKEADAKTDISTDGDYVTTQTPWHLFLGPAVAKLYFCAYFFRNLPQSRRQHCFVGTQANTAVARGMFAYLIGAVNRLARDGCKKLPPAEHSPYRTTFRVHATMRLQARLNERRQAAEQGKIKAIEVADDGTTTETNRNLPALLSTYKAEEERVYAFMSKEYPIMKKSKAKLSTIHAQGMLDGRAAGDKIGLDPQVEKRAAQRRIANGC